MAKAQGNSTGSPTDIAIAIFGGAIAVVLLYMYVLKPLLHPLFFYWKWLLMMPCFFIGKMLPTFCSTLRDLFISFRPEKLQFLDNMFVVFDPKFPADLLEQASKSGSYDFSTMVSVVSAYAPLSLIIFVPITLLYISRIKNIYTFQTLYNRETLLRENQKVFTSIIPIVERDINKEYLNIGPWSMPEPPLFYCIVHKLLVVEPKNYVEGQKLDPNNMEFFSMGKVYQGLTDDIHSKELRNANLVPDPKSPYLRKNNFFRADIAAGLFLRQMGIKFINGHFIGALKRKSRQECGNYWRAVFAGMLYRFGANSSDKKKIAFPILDKFAKAFKGKGPISASAFTFCTEELVDELWDGFDSNYRFCMEVLPFVTFEYSFMMHLGSFAKKNGKLSPSDFLWMRPIDRTLYFSLDQIGARVGHIETIGPWSHYNGELVNGFGLHIPYLTNAVEGLYLTLASEGWVPSRNINFDQKEMIEEIIRTNPIWDEEPATTQESLESVYAAALRELAKIPDWERIWNILRPYPEQILHNPFCFFSEEDIQFLTEHTRDFMQPVGGGSVALCPILGLELQEDAVAVPLYDIKILPDNSAFATISKVVVISATANTYVKESMTDTTKRNAVIDALVARGYEKKILLDIFDMYSDITELYARIGKLSYDPESSVYADLKKIQKS